MIAAFARTLALLALAYAGVAAAADEPKTTPIPFREFVSGNPKAKVTVIEYASLSCPHCAHWQADTYPKLKKDYIDTGKIKFVYRDFPLDTRALAGAVIARCVEPEKGYRLVQVLFAEQETWAAAQNPLEPLKALAKSVGISESETDACLEKKDLISGILDERERSVKTYQIDATPAFFINDKSLQGNAPFDEMKTLIEAELKAKK